jgi:hypothetical protein
MPKKTESHSKTRTLRIDAELDSVIQSDAERLGMSPNALINKTLQRYKDVRRYNDPQYFLLMSLETFSAILDKLSIEEIEDIGYEYGHGLLHENLLKRGREINHENIRWYIKQGLGENSGWFRCDLYEKEGGETMHLIHNLGRKWSHFLANYVSSIIREEEGLKVQSVIMENNVHLTITK